MWVDRITRQEIFPRGVAIKDQKTRMMKRKHLLYDISALFFTV